MARHSARCAAVSTTTSTNNAHEVHTPKRVRGMHDHINADEVYRRQIVRQAFVSVAESHAFQEVETPIVEDASLFLRTLGDGSDVVGKEMYTFPDRAKSLLALRPEGTASIMRAVLAQQKSGGGSSGDGLQHTPQKLYYAGPMFRHERPQRGRYRQFTQVGVEYIGGPSSMPTSGGSVDAAGSASSAFADAEVIGLAQHFLKRLGIVDRCTLRINTLGSPACRKKYQQTLLDHFRSLPAGALSEASRDKLEFGRVLRILDSKDATDRMAVADAPIIKEFLAPEAYERHLALLDFLKGANIPFVQDWHLVRGLDYYCHSAFEFVYDDPEFVGVEEGGTSDGGGTLGAAQGTVLAGGRYDGLAASLGYRARGNKRATNANAVVVPAVGWAAGVERLSLVLPDTMASQGTKVPTVTLGFLRTAGCSTIDNDAATAAAFHQLCATLQQHQQQVHTLSVVHQRGGGDGGDGGGGSGGGGNGGGSGGGGARGIRTATPFRLHQHYGASKMPQLLRVCEATESKILLLVGVDELANGVVTVRDLETRQQETVDLASVHECVGRMLAVSKD